MRGADEDGPRLDPASLLNRRPDGLNCRATDEERIDADDRHAGLAIVKHHRADLAGIVKRLVVSLAVPAGLLHADRGRDISFREPGFETRCGAASASTKGEQTRLSIMASKPVSRHENGS